MDGLLVLPFRHGPFWNFSYLIACRETREAAVIDPAWDPAAILAATAEHALTIRQVLLTHAHTDHVNAAASVLDATGARAIVHAAEADDLPGDLDGRRTTVAGNESFDLGRITVTAMHTPGHSQGSMAFLAGARLFSGDTLGIGGVGRPGPGREALEALWGSVAALRALAPETVIHPGHDDGPSASSTVGEEIARVEALRAESFAQFVEALERATGRSHRHED